MQSTQDSNITNDDSNKCKIVIRICFLTKTNEAIEHNKRLPVRRCLLSF